MSFRIKGRPAEPFAPLFSLADEDLAARGGLRRTADSSGYPCRVSLTDAAPGQEVLLVHYEHHPVDSPFRSSHAIYVRDGEETYDAVDQVPEMLRRRMLSVRAFDERGMMVDADIADGSELEGLISRLFEDESAAYLHVHFARPGLLRRPGRQGLKRAPGARLLAAEASGIIG